jgi:hypothetical protein
MAEWGRRAPVTPFGSFHLLFVRQRRYSAANRSAVLESPRKTGNSPENAENLEFDFSQFIRRIM